MNTDQDYKNAALEYVLDFFRETNISADAPLYDESGTDGENIYVKVHGGNQNYEIVLNDNLEVLDCQVKL